MKLATLTIIASLVTSTAFAAGSDDHSHGDDEGGQMEMMAIGMPGSADKVDRTIDVAMRETDDGDMIFQFHSISLIS